MAGVPFCPAPNPNPDPYPPQILTLTQTLSLHAGLDINFQTDVALAVAALRGSWLGQDCENHLFFP